MYQVFALDIDLSTTQFPGEVGRKVEGRRPTDVVVEEVIELLNELRVNARRRVLKFKFLKGSHQCLWHKAPPVVTKSTSGIWKRRARSYAGQYVFLCPLSLRTLAVLYREL